VAKNFLPFILETMNKQVILGIDMGGTQVRAGLVRAGMLSSIIAQRIHSQGTLDEVLQNLYTLTDQLMNDTVTAIGIGVPGLVDEVQATVYDVVNIPSWKEVPLKQLLEQRYKVPVLINNDANCFAVGEYYFGKGKGHDTMVGLTIGTGLGSGIIINKKLYAGKNGGAGEFGMISYLDKYYEYYASGQFFQNVYQTDGETIFKNAKGGDTNALKMYNELGMHLGNAIQTILYAFDTNLIVLGGSVSQAFPYFSQTMWQQIKNFVFTKTVKELRIEVSELTNSGILGAAALHYNLND
jgi:glucokinase